MSIFSKLRDFVGLNEPVEYDYEYDEMDGQEYQSLYQEENTTPAPAPIVEEDSRARRAATTNRFRDRAAVIGTEAGVGAAMNNASSNSSAARTEVCGFEFDDHGSGSSSTGS